MKRGRKSSQRVPKSIEHVCDHLTKDGIRFMVYPDHRKLFVPTNTEHFDFDPFTGVWVNLETKQRHTGIVRMIKHVRGKQPEKCVIDCLWLLVNQ